MGLFRRPGGQRSWDKRTPYRGQALVLLPTALPRRTYPRTSSDARQQATHSGSAHGRAGIAVDQRQWIGST